MSYPTFLELLALKKIDENVYQTLENPLRMGNALPIAYGGCAISWACQAAHLSLPAGSKHRIYSIQGNYLGPTASDRPVKIKITSLRETRTFVTRLVLLFQDFDGKERSCLSCIVDFYISSGNIMLKYSMPPKDQVTHHSKLLSIENRLEQLVGAGKLTRAQADSDKKTFGPFRSYFESRPPPEGISYHNAIGINYEAKTNQDDREIYEKINYDWFRVKESLSPNSSTSNKAQERIPLKTDPNKSTCIDASLLTWILDAAIAFIPLTFTHRFLNHAKACSSLDFSLRFHTDDLDLNPSSWFLRDMKTYVADDERTYSSANCWKEEKDGSLTLVASMTQASILRGPEQEVSKL